MIERFDRYDFLYNGRLNKHFWATAKFPDERLSEIGGGIFDFNKGRELDWAVMDD